MTRSSADKTLVVLIEGTEAGHVSEGSNGRLDFSYLPEWQENPDATPLSLSMPLAKRSHNDAVVRPFMWGLLPDNDRVIERWARTYQVSSRNPFALLRHVGEDVAGAVQFVSPDRDDAGRPNQEDIDWLTTSEVEEWLVNVVRDPTLWHLQGTGQFSLAGAQPKGALYYDDQHDRWGVPHGATPTTHILKPAVVDLDGHDLNEHICLETARRVGLSAAHTEVRSFGGERAIVVERYDRERLPDGTVRRIHQEDICQALGITPAAKYQSDGGPDPAQIVGLLRSEIRPAADAADDVLRIVDALALN
jgi:serine/threonine-protein kinase HipA